MSIGVLESVDHRLVGTSIEAVTDPLVTFGGFQNLLMAASLGNATGYSCHLPLLTLIPFVVRL